MTEALITLYKTLLFNVPNTTPTLKIYAIVDSIRDEAVKEKILFSELNHTDLWHEELFENEQEVPLYLIELDKENELLDYLLNNHKKSIATYFISPYDIDTLQSYYSMFTHVNIEIEENNFQKGIFGFYDPNILPNYIQTLYNEAKADEFFAGVAMWLSPSVEKEEELYLAFRSKEGEVDDVTLQLDTLSKEKHFQLNFNDVQLPNNSMLDVHEVYIDRKQLVVFEESEKRKFIDKIFEEYKAEGHIFYYPEAFNKELAFSFYDEAEALGFISEVGKYTYILLALFITTPIIQLPIYHQLILPSTEEEKIDKINIFMVTIIEERRVLNGN